MVDANLDVAEECVATYNRMKMTKDIKYVVYKVEEQKVVVVDKVGQLDASFHQFHHDLGSSEPRFAVFDFTYETADGLKPSKIIFIHWCPDNSKVLHKMVYASTKENLKRRFVGISREIQASAADEVNEAAFLAAVRV